MKKLIIPLLSFLLLSCGPGNSGSDATSGSGAAPTKEDINTAMHKQYDTPADNFNPKHAVEIHNVSIGITEPTNEQDRIDGIPGKSDVTMVKVDYTDRSYYNDKTIAYRREITAKAFRDDFGEWKVMTDGSRSISTVDEPAQPQ